MHRILPLVFFLFAHAALAQDDDYYDPENSRVEQPSVDLKELHRWGPKLGIEAHGSIGYSHYYVPMTISGAFAKATGGFGYDGGVGVRIRLYHKLAIAGGFTFSGRGYDVQYMAGATGTNANGQQVTYEFDVFEKARLTFVGFYIKPVIELSRKFHLAILFHPGWLLTYRGESLVVGTAPASIAGQRDTLNDQPPVEGFENKLFEFGLEFSYKWNIAPQLILKPHIGLNFATSPIFHTGAELPTPFGPWEQNPSFMTLRVGVIFETGLWMDEPKTRSIR